MIITESYIDIMNETDQLITYILQSDVMQTYEEAKLALDTDLEAQTLIKAFEAMKDDYEDVQRFGMYHPDYYDIMKNVRSVKRKMDMDDKVAAFKIAERQMEQFLYEISKLLAESVSENIMVPYDGAALTDSGCSSGGCGTGGSCGCQAS